MARNVWSFRSCFINDNVAIHLSYLRKYGAYRITVETLNRPFVLPHRASLCCLSSVRTICQTFSTSKIVSFDPTGRYFSPNITVRYPKNVSYYNFESREKERYPALRFSTSIHRRAYGDIDSLALFIFLGVRIGTMTSWSDA